MRILDLLHIGVLVDDQDLPLLAGHNGWYLQNSGYIGMIVNSMPRRGVLLHRVITGAGQGVVVDHINGNKLDNCRANLRLVDQTKNQANRKRLNRNNSSGMGGVSYSPKASSRRPWRAQIMAKRRTYHLGMFETAEEAVDARRAAELDLFGEYCP